MTGVRRLLFSFALAAGLRAAGPDTWIPARWEGGPLEVARRARDKAPPDPAARETIARWYDPSTLALLDGMPVNCLVLTSSGGGDAKTEEQQQPLVKEYTRKAHERRLAVLGSVYPGSGPDTVASSAADAGLDGLVLEGFAGAPGFAAQLTKELRSRNSAAVVIPVESSLRPAAKTALPVLAVEGASPGTGKLADGVTASASGGLWVDSNLWLVRSVRLSAGTRPVWLTHRVSAGTPAPYLRSIADAAAMGARWMIALDDDLRRRLRSGDVQAAALWRSMGDLVTFFGQHAEWPALAPFGAVGIVVDTAAPNPAGSEEFQNLVARRRIVYRLIDRSRLDAPSLDGLRAVLAFDLAPPAEAERKLLRDFAAQGGLVLGGPAWGDPPKDQSYAVRSVGEGEIAVYKEDNPQSVAQDLNDLLTTPDFGVSFFNAPSVLPCAGTDTAGDRLVIQLVNYADAPAESLTVWATRRWKAAHLYLPGSAPADLPLKRSGGRTEIVIPRLPVYAALVLEQ